jgi:hypothetical protein
MIDPFVRALLMVYAALFAVAGYRFYCAKREREEFRAEHRK